MSRGHTGRAPLFTTYTSGAGARCQFPSPGIIFCYSPGGAIRLAEITAGARADGTGHDLIKIVSGSKFVVAHE